MKKKQLQEKLAKIEEGVHGLNEKMKDVPFLAKYKIMIMVIILALFIPMPLSLFIILMTLIINGNSLMSDFFKERPDLKVVKDSEIEISDAPEINKSRNESTKKTSKTSKTPKTKKSNKTKENKEGK